MQETTESHLALTSPSYNPQLLLINGNKVFLPSALANQDSLPLFLTLSSAVTSTLTYLMTSLSRYSDLPVLFSEFQDVVKQGGFLVFTPPGG